jgi:hypothetical protein
MITYPTLIGISGPAGSGKNFLGDCIAQVLQDNNFSQTHVGGFADELKREVLDALVKGEAPPEFWSGSLSPSPFTKGCLSLTHTH